MKHLPVILFAVWLAGWPVAAGYFITRPWCNTGAPQDPVACGLFTGIFWPLTVTASVTARILR